MDEVELRSLGARRDSFSPYTDEALATARKQAGVVHAAYTYTFVLSISRGADLVGASFFIHKKRPQKLIRGPVGKDHGVTHLAYNAISGSASLVQPRLTPPQPRLMWATPITSNLTFIEDLSNLKRQTIVCLPLKHLR